MTITQVSDLPKDVQAQLDDRDLIVFDGVCVLCSGFFRFMTSIDRHERFHFATAQGPIGQVLYRALDLPTDAFETNLVIVDGRIYQRLPAFVAAMDAVGWPWRAALLLRALPRPLADALYHRIARNRYAIFGQRETCLVPDAAIRSRFLDAPTP